MHKKIFEINPRHPLIIKMLELKVDDKVEELRDAATLLFETTGIRSGFSMKDTNSYASLVEKLLRKHLGVDLEAAADVEEIAVAEELDESEKPVKPIETESDEDEVEEVDADDAAPKGFNVKVNNDLKDEPKEQVVQKIDMSKFKRNGESDDDEEDEDEDDNMHVCRGHASALIVYSDFPLHSRSHYRMSSRCSVIMCRPSMSCDHTTTTWTPFMKREIIKTNEQLESFTPMFT